MKKLVILLALLAINYSIIAQCVTVTLNVTPATCEDFVSADGSAVYY